MISMFLISWDTNVIPKLILIIIVTICAISLFFVTYEITIASTRFIIYSNGIIPPHKPFRKIFKQSKYFIPFSEIIFISLNNDQLIDKRFNDIKIYLRNLKTYKINFDELTLEAHMIIKRIKDDNYPDKADRHYNEAINFMIRKKYDDTLRHISMALELIPSNPYYWNLKASALGELGRYDEALKAVNKAIEISPNYAEAWNNKSVIFEDLGKLPEALNYIEKALELKIKENKSSILRRRDIISNKLKSISSHQ